MFIPLCVYFHGLILENHKKFWLTILLPKVWNCIWYGMCGIFTPLSDVCSLVCFLYFVTVKPCVWERCHIPHDCVQMAVTCVQVIVPLLFCELCWNCLAQTLWKCSLQWMITQAELQLISKLFLTSLQSFHCQNPGAYCWIFLLVVNKNRFPDHNTFSTNYEHVNPLAHAYLWQKPHRTVHVVWCLCIPLHLWSTKPVAVQYTVASFQNNLGKEQVLCLITCLHFRETQVLYFLIHVWCCLLGSYLIQCDAFSTLLKNHRYEAQIPVFPKKYFYKIKTVTEDLQCCSLFLLVNLNIYYS